MPKVFTQAEKDLAMKLAGDGLTHGAIGASLAKDFPGNWKGLKSPERAVARLLKEARSQQKAATQVPVDKTLDEMTREERYHFISQKLLGTPRFRLTFRNFDQEEKDLFIEEYLNVIKSTDTITEAEEQALFAAILELVLAVQSLSRKERQEKLHHETLEGRYQEGDVGYTPFLSDAEKYAKEYDAHMKLYQKGMEQLKMARRDRLKDVRTERRTLVDLAEELSTKSARSSAANEITELSKLRDDQLKEMLEKGYLFGKFED